MPPFPSCINRYRISAFLLLLLIVAVYQKALSFVPASGDDLRILSSVSRTPNPLSYFVTDWGMKGTYRLANGQIDLRRRSYRPLHSISIWIGYRMFGVSAFPNQLINLILHLMNGMLLFTVLRRLGLDAFLVLILSTVGLVSLYTASPATWVSDRQTLVVAMAVLLLLSHVVDGNGKLRHSMNLWLVAALTIVSVLFQEGGLIIPLIAAVVVIMTPGTGVKWRPLTVCALLAASYLGLRVLLFGANAFAYASEGFVFGNRSYTLLSELPWQMALWARCESVMKNFVCVFFPIINPMGRIDSIKELIADPFSWLPTLALAVVATRRPLTRIQWLALAIVALNSALHAQVFRYRVEYIPELSFCLYVAASTIWRARERGYAVTRRQLALSCCVILALVSIFQVNSYIRSNWMVRQDEMTKRHLATIVSNYPISGVIVQQVLAHYAPAIARPTTNPAE